LDELPSELGRVAAAPPLQPASVLGRDQSGQLLTVVVRGDRRQTTAADCGDTGAFGLDAAASLGMIGVGNELFVTGSNLQGKRALSGFRQQFLRLEAQADLAVEAEPVESAGGKYDSVEAPLPALAQARIDVSAQRLDRELGLER
jgi:hypothetical protein